MSGLELGKAATTAGAWAWKRREARFENPFTDFLKRRWEDVKSNSEKANTCKPAGMSSIGGKQLVFKVRYAIWNKQFYLHGQVKWSKVD